MKFEFKLSVNEGYEATMCGHQSRVQVCVHVHDVVDRRNMICLSNLPSLAAMAVGAIVWNLV